MIFIKISEKKILLFQALGTNFNHLQLSLVSISLSYF